MSIDLSRRPISLCATWRSRLESSRTANVSPSWRESHYKVIVLSGDWRASATKRWRKLCGLENLARHLYLPFTPSILYYKPSDFPSFIEAPLNAGED